MFFGILAMFTTKCHLMKRFIQYFFTLLLFSSCDFSNYIVKEEYDFTTVFEKSDGKETATYAQVIEYYEDLAAAFPTVKLQEIGETDSGKPLHLAIFSASENFDLEMLRSENSILLINNGIHPGESDGIDATMMLFRDLAQDSIPVPENTIITAIPVYNVGGALNRNSATRANQNGPEEYGFRGNARNYDLNRDFIKADAKNTRTFYQIFHQLRPDVFIDTHVSNGADYQYTLTHLFTQHNKLGGQLGNYLNEDMMPSLKEALLEKEMEITPYVNVFDDVPEAGFNQFMDYPRYSTGYTTLWNTLGMMVETHMLKPYEQRVEGTYELLRSMITITDEDSKVIKELRAKAFANFEQKENFEFKFVPDTTNPSKIEFRGYEADTVQSEVTGAGHLRYDRSKPFTREISYYDNFEATDEITIPEAYIVPQGWWEVLQLLELNQVEMEVFGKDSILQAEVYHIADFKTVESPFEGHYLHFDTEVRKSQQQIEVRAGDFYVPTNQPAIRYLLQTLEPEAIDSFFNWNFFDIVLQQKEHFSSYVFEDEAEEFLEDNPKIEEEFLQKKKEDPEFAADAYAQLNWIYQHTAHYEKAHLRYPVFRILR